MPPQWSSPRKRGSSVSCSDCQPRASAQAAAITLASETDAHYSSASASRETYVNPPSVLPVTKLVDELIKPDRGAGDPPADLERRAELLAGEVRCEAQGMTGCSASADLGIQGGRTKTARNRQWVVEQGLNRVQSPCEKREILHQPKRRPVLDCAHASGVRPGKRSKRKVG